MSEENTNQKSMDDISVGQESTLNEIVKGEEENRENEKDADVFSNKTSFEEESNVSVYDEKDFISSPFVNEGCTVPLNILEFQHSLGYHCQQHSNLCVLDTNTIAFTSGNLIHFLNVSEKRLWFRRSCSGGGLGHITKNPMQPHFAVGEKGDFPLIIVYNWPSMDIVSVLKKGTAKVYTHLNYSPDGELLCSMGGHPDYLFTVWNWRRSRILLRTKSPAQDVFKAAFSEYMPGHITSAGNSHVRFWKMARTFTGLKLKGEVGRFGKTEVSDVIGILAMPDEKVVSGSEWGNILVWEAGLIKVEVTRKGRKTCHNGPITQFEYSNGELTTLGKDGFVKVWYFETIDLADPPEDDRFVEVEPMFELEIGDEFGPASLMCMMRKEPGEGLEGLWYSQDSNGGIWLMDLTVSANAVTPQRILTAHSGSVTGLAVAPHAPYFATLGQEGRLHVYSSTKGVLLIARPFPSTGHALLWLPTSVASSGSVLVLGGGDGVLRVVAVNLAEAEKQLPKHSGTALGTADLVTLLQVSKAHSTPATALALSDDFRYLASGCQDGTVFIFEVIPNDAFASLKPVGSVQGPDAIGYLAFKPNDRFKILCCGRGQVIEFELPENPTHDVHVSYKYTEAKQRTINFKSIKSQILRDEYLAQVQARKDAKREVKREQLEKLRKENPGLDIVEEVFLADSDDEEELEPLYIPPEPAAILWATYIADDLLWLSASGYDCGFIYEYSFGQKDPIASIALPDDRDVEIHSFLYFRKKKYLFFGLGDGSIRCMRIKTNSADLTDYWRLGMHDSSHGAVAFMAVSPDEKHFFSAGFDGNVFHYATHPDDKEAPPTVLGVAKRIDMPHPVEDIYGDDVPTLEDERSKAEHVKKMKLASERKQRVEQVLWGLADMYSKLIRRNRGLPQSQMIPHNELELDPRISANTREVIEAENALMRRKMAWDLERARLQYHKLSSFYTDAVIGHRIRVRGVRKNCFVETIRQKKLSAEMEAAKSLVQMKLDEADRRGRTVERELSVEDDGGEVVLAPAPVESFLRGISAFEKRFTVQLRRLLDKYNSRKYKRERRALEWSKFMKKKPDVNKNNPEDEEAIREAEATIGDYKLKSDPDYRVPPSQVVHTADKYKELLRVREQLDTLVGDFNASVFALRKRKAGLSGWLGQQAMLLRRLHGELPKDLHLTLDALNGGDLTTDYPEKQYEISEEDISAEMEKLGFRRQSKLSRLATEPEMPVDEELEVLLGPSGRDFGVSVKCETLSRVYDERNLTQGKPGEGDPDTWESIVSSLAPSAELRKVSSDTDMTTLCAMGEDDEVNTVWENEMRAMRLMRKVWEQKELVTGVEREINALDNEIEELSAKRNLVQRDAVLLRLRLLSLHQELVIIKACEEREELLSAKVEEKEADRRAAKMSLNATQNKIDAKGRESTRLQEKEKEIHHKFMEAIGDNQFADYLRKIFKKKYRAPRGSDEESSEESSSTSEEEGEDEGSLESRDFGAMRLDDTFCPPGCSRELFDLALELRSQRHTVERDQVDLKVTVELLRKDQEAGLKTLKQTEELLAKNQEDLQLFQREKQQRLNEVDTIVILKLSQLQHVRPDGRSFELLKNTLVFNTGVLADLDHRVQQLHDEAKAQRAKHKKNRTHLRRMVVDVNFMKERLRSLKEQIEEAHYRKFGAVIDLTELEQALLRRFVWELRSSANEIRAEFQHLIDSMKAVVRKKFLGLMRVTEQNTQRHNLQVVLVQEHTRLKKIITVHKKVRKVYDTEEAMEEDINTLRALVESLSGRRAKLLEHAIRLRYKGSVLPAVGRVSSRLPPDALRSGPSAYHGACYGEEVPFPRGPWPPATIAAIKNPMYLGDRQQTVPPVTPTTPKSPSRRSTVHVRIENTDLEIDIPHKNPLDRKFFSLESLTQGMEGFMAAELRDIAPIAAEEKLSATMTQDHEDDTDDLDEDLWSNPSAKELFNSITASRVAEAPVDEFLERLKSVDADHMLELVADDNEYNLSRQVSFFPDEDTDPEPEIEALQKAERFDENDSGEDA